QRPEHYFQFRDLTGVVELEEVDALDGLVVDGAAKNHRRAAGLRVRLDVVEALDTLGHEGQDVFDVCAVGRRFEDGRRIQRDLLGEQGLH
ncbi:hypothetical protein DF186_16565, partial [Enterococcus hirae]